MSPLTTCRRVSWPAVGARASTGSIPSDLALKEREDIGEGDWVVARVSYQDAAGGYFAASMQKHPSGGLRDEAFTYGGRIPIQTLESGTEYVVKEPSPAPAQHVQVIIRRPDRLTLQMNTGGRPGKNIPRPMSRDHLLDLARRADEALTNQEHPGTCPWPRESSHLWP